jgi:hypothetical protein
MLRVIARTSTLTRKHHIITKPSVCRALRYNSTSNDTDYSHKVYALPFKLPEEKVHQIVNIASYVNQHAFFGIFKIIKSVSLLLIEFSPKARHYSSCLFIDIHSENARCERISIIHASA